MGIQNIAANHSTKASPSTAEGLYLDLLKKCLTRTLFANTDEYQATKPPRVQHALVVRTGIKKIRDRFGPPVHALLMKRARYVYIYVYIMLQRTFNPWPVKAETMIGMERLDNLQDCITDVLRCRVPGDLIETGVWRGGATIFMRAVLKAYGDTARTVWAADSFRGLPKPDVQRAPADKGDVHWAFGALAIPVEEVQANFARYGLLDDQVRFLVGWFRDTLPTAPIKQLAILRLDGDLYESTTDALYALYPKLSIGGYVIVDDYHLPPCRAAIHEYRAKHGITEQIVSIDEGSVFWRRLE